MKKFIPYIFIYLIFIACEKEIHIPIEMTEPQLVVNSVFDANNFWKLEISTSKYVYSNNQINFIDSASIKIIDSNGNIISVTNRGNGIYTSDNEKPQYGKTYTLEVEYNNYKKAIATDQLPDEILIDTVTWNEDVFWDGIMQKKVKITFQDSPARDFYYLQLLDRYSWTYIDYETGLVDTVYEENPIYFTSQDAAVENFSTDSWDNIAIFSDKIFNNQQYTFDLLVEDFYFNAGSDSNSGIKVVLHRISEDFYKYLKSFEAYKSSNEDDLFPQPVQVYTNIENGLGIFAGQSKSFYIIPKNVIR